MGLGSILLGIFSFLLMIAGVLFVMVPFLGTMLSFLSPILAITGVVLGGVAMSRARQGMGESEGLATAGLVINILAFIPAMLVALTCGLCNTMCTGMYLTPNDPTRQVPWDRDGGVRSNPIEDLFAPPDASVAHTGVPNTGVPNTGVPNTDVPRANVPSVDVPSEGPTPVPMRRQGDETELPPPPLPPGPTTPAPLAPAPPAPSTTEGSTPAASDATSADTTSADAAGSDTTPAPRSRRSRRATSP